MPPRVPETGPGLADARKRSIAANTRWIAGPAAAAAMAFAGIDKPDAAEERAIAFLADPDGVETLLAPLVEALREDPWFEPAFRVSRDRLRTGAVLLDCAAVTISATITCARELNRLPMPATVVLPGRVSLTCYVRGGNAWMRRWRATPAGTEFSASTAAPAHELAPRLIEDGMLIRQDGRTAGHLLISAESDVVALTVTIKPGAALLMREYAIADGAFVRAACADDSASRIEMLLTFLRVSGRADAGAMFENASRHPAFHLRWSAMREWLMLDGESARDRLAEMRANDPNAEIRLAATATLSALDQRLEQACRA